MTYFAQNIQYLRKRQKLSQEEIAQELGISRSTVNNYENAYAEPGLKTLIDFSRHFKISTDALLGINLSELAEQQLKDLEADGEGYIRGSKLRVLATTVDAYNNENIELVPQRARAGYTAGYHDPEYIRTLPTFQLPFLSADRKYRTFQISGDSMLPIPDKSYVIGEYVSDWHEVKDGGAYIVLTRDEGIVFKIVFNQIKLRKNFLLRSLNPVYEPYELPVSEVLEIWKFVNYISNQIPEPAVPGQDSLLESVTRITEEAERITRVLAKRSKALEAKKRKIK
jgi:transcriptional regulator with XRE-family HTH domain